MSESAPRKQSRQVRLSQGDVLDAKQTVHRFLASVASDKQLESLAPSQKTGLPSEETVARLVEQVLRASKDDPFAYATVGSAGNATQLRNDLSGAFNHIAASDTEHLSQAELSALEAIALLSGRPALLVRDDDFELPSGIWQLLAAHRPNIRRMLRSVGRLELPEIYGGGPAGTAFVVGEGLVMTNRHVVDAWCTSTAEDVHGRPVAWHFEADFELSLDFKGEFGASQRSIFRVAAIEAVVAEPMSGSQQPDVDLALLRLTPAAGGVCWPAPLRIQSDAASLRKGARVCVAGYPGEDDTRNSPTEMDRIFNSTYDVKRLAPGEVTGLDLTAMALTHDCSTLGGNSGSCVFDLDTNSVIGLHWGGQYLKQNRAVMLPALLSGSHADLLHGVNFQAN